MAKLSLYGSIKHTHLNIEVLFDMLQAFAIGNIQPASSIRMRLFDPISPFIVGGVEYYDMHFPDANGKMSHIYDKDDKFQAYAIYSSVARQNQEILILDGINDNCIDWTFQSYGPASNFYNSINLLYKLDLVPLIDDYKHEHHSGNVQRVIHNWIVDFNINGSFETSIDGLTIDNTQIVHINKELIAALI